MAQTFDHLLVLGRPAGGKSEFIDFLEKTPDDKRAERYHIGRFDVMDDFVWLWEKFEEDDLWERVGKQRLFSKKFGENYGLTDNTLFHFLIERFNQDIPKKYISKPEFYKDGTLLIEFSRGGKHGYREALSRLSPEVIKRSSILYINVSFEESWRRNVARYQEKLRHSILAHMVPRETMEELYSIDDWADLTGGKDSGYLNFDGFKIPFVTMGNEPESADPVVLDERYGSALGKLMQLKSV